MGMLKTSKGKIVDVSKPCNKTGCKTPVMKPQPKPNQKDATKPAFCQSHDQLRK